MPLGGNASCSESLIMYLLDNGGAFCIFPRM